jgi:hypothetical protein
MNICDQTTIKHEGREFKVTKYYDEDHSAPWIEQDGHGVIREISSRYGRPDKKPGEVVIHSDRGHYWLYDIQETTQIAKRDQWGLCPEDVAKLGLKTRGEIVRESVRRDMKHCEGYLEGWWHYIGVCVQIIGPDGEPEGEPFTNAIWGIDSSGDYWEEVARELADSILFEKREAWRTALKEARERRYWNSQDVVTA